jgi:adhesin/invasin
VVPSGIVTVTGDSIIAIGVGSATVTAQNPNNAAVTQDLPVTVTNAPANVVLSDTGDTFARLGQKVQYSATVTNSQGIEISPATVDWTTAACASPPVGVAPNAAAVTLSPATGKFVTVTAAGSGCATVTATSGSVTADADFVGGVARSLYVNQVVGAAQDTGSIDLEHGTLKYPFRTLASSIAFGTANSGDTVVIQRTPAPYVQSVNASVGNLTVRGDTSGCGVGCTASELPTLAHGAQAPIIRAVGVPITFEDLIISANADTAALQVDATGGDNVKVNRIVISDPNSASDASGLRIDGSAGNVTIDSLLAHDLGVGITMIGSATDITITKGRYHQNDIGIQLPATISGALNITNNDLFDNDGAGLDGSPTSGVPFGNWWGDNRGPRAETGFDTTAVGDSIAFNGSFIGTVTGFDPAPNSSTSVSSADSLFAKLSANTVVSGRVLVSKNQSNKWVATLAVRAVDADGLPVSGVTVDSTASTAQTGDQITPNSQTTGSDGIARFEIELNDRQGQTDLTGFLRTVTFSITGGGSGSADIDVVFPAAGVPAQYILTVPDTTPDAGIQFTLTATLTDAAGDLVSETGRTVTWATTNGGNFSSPNSAVTNGVATVLFTPSQTPAVTHTLSATDAEGMYGELDVTTVIGPAAAAQSTITADSATMAANGVSISTITVQLNDQFGNALTGSGGTVALSLDPTTPWTFGGLTDEGDGTWTATLNASQDAGTVTINGTLDTGGGPEAIGTSGSVDFEQQVANAGNSSVDASPTTIETAGGSPDESTITVTAVDANGNFIKNASVTVTSSGGTDDTITPVTPTTDENGEATFTFSSTVADDKDITASITAGGSTIDVIETSLIVVENP